MQIAGLTLVRAMHASALPPPRVGTQHASYDRMVVKLRLVPPGHASDPPEPLPQGRTLPGWAKAASVTAAIVVGFALYFYCAGAERRAIHDLPVGERRALFERTLKSLQSLCSPAEESLRDAAREYHRGPIHGKISVDATNRACRNLADRQLARLPLPR